MRRRDFLQLIGGSLAAAGCFRDLPTEGEYVPSDGRLTARPADVPLLLPTGLLGRQIGDAAVATYLPAAAASRARIPTLVFLHGADRSIQFALDVLAPICEAAGVLLVAPISRRATWDAIHGPFGEDRRNIDTVLAWLFSQAPIDPANLVLSGFSDGATYSLALGRANGDLFPRLVAFAPGYVTPVDPVGLPSILVVHGTGDPVLPFANARDVIVPTLREAGHEVQLISFDGGHVVDLPSATAEIERLGGPRAAVAGRAR